MPRKAQEPRMLTTLLELAGRRSTFVAGDHPKRMAKQKVVAEMVWDLAITQRTVLPDGEEMVLSAREWVDLVKWLYSQVDGPPKQTVDLTSGDKPIGFKVYAGFDPSEV